MSEGLKNSPWCCGNSGVALITLIGGLGAENIIEFDLTHTHTYTNTHPHTHTLQIQSTGALVIVRRLNYLERSTSIWDLPSNKCHNKRPPPPRPRQHFPTSSDTTLKDIDLKTGKDFSQDFSSCSAKENCLLIDTSAKTLSHVVTSGRITRWTTVAGEPVAPTPAGRGHARTRVTMLSFFLYNRLLLQYQYWGRAGLFNFYFYCLVSVPFIVYRSPWWLIISIGPEKIISIDPFYFVQSEKKNSYSLFKRDVCIIDSHCITVCRPFLFCLPINIPTEDSWLSMDRPP